MDQLVQDLEIGFHDLISSNNNRCNTLGKGVCYEEKYYQVQLQRRDQEVVNLSVRSGDEIFVEKDLCQSDHLTEDFKQALVMFTFL